MLITRTSHYSGVERTLDLPITAEQWARYRSGELIQVAFPHLNADQREFIMSGCTAEEWDEMFPPEEDDEDPDALITEALLIPPPEDNQDDVDRRIAEHEKFLASEGAKETCQEAEDFKEEKEA